jgi:EAL domain-containing protein (putative c-di-GMP-specific phosphodiesterase class I)
MSVNVSAVQLNHDGLENDVRDALTDSGLDPAMLTLEITETALMRCRRSDQATRCAQGTRDSDRDR